jgi:hypothetical protein
MFVIGRDVEGEMAREDFHLLDGEREEPSDAFNAVLRTWS